MEASPQIHRRIFVVGVPRSGTTLVQSLLAAHSTMTSFTESHFFSRHFAMLPLLQTPLLTRDPSPRLREFLTENHEAPVDATDWFEGPGRRALRWRILLPLFTQAVARRLLQVLDQLTLRRGCSGWIEKTPRHLRYIPLLEGVPKGAHPPRFVHVIREGLETVASLHRASQSWEEPYDVEFCVRRWNTEVRYSLDRISSSADPFVLYEELTAHPEETLRRLLDGLGLAWEPTLLERYAQTSERLIARKEVWKEGVGRRIQRSATSHRVLSTEQRDRANRGLHHHLYDQLRKLRGSLS